MGISSLPRVYLNPFNNQRSNRFNDSLREAKYLSHSTREELHSEAGQIQKEFNKLSRDPQYNTKFFNIYATASQQLKNIIGYHETNHIFNVPEKIDNILARFKIVIKELTDNSLIDELHSEATHVRDTLLGLPRINQFFDEYNKASSRLKTLIGYDGGTPTVNVQQKIDAILREFDVVIKELATPTNAGSSLFAAAPPSALDTGTVVDIPSIPTTQATVNSTVSSSVPDINNDILQFVSSLPQNHADNTKKIQSFLHANKLKNPVARHDSKAEDFANFDPIINNAIFARLPSSLQKEILIQQSVYFYLSVVPENRTSDNFFETYKNSSFMQTQNKKCQLLEQKRSALSTMRSPILQQKQLQEELVELKKHKEMKEKLIKEWTETPMQSPLLKQNVASLKEQINLEINPKIAALEEQIPILGAQITALQPHIATLKQSIQTLEHLTAEFAQFKNTIIHNINNIHLMIGRHQFYSTSRILELRQITPTQCELILS